MRRGVELLERGRGYGMLSFGHTSPPDRVKLQAALTSLGVATTALYPAFNRYAGASILGSTSELHELRRDRMTDVARKAMARPALYGGSQPAHPPLRLHGMQPQRWELGTGEIPTTIEALKEIGCPACGNHDFRRASKR